jgi:oxygen-independent coproporphyrinogen-3 oxidase
MLPAFGAEAVRFSSPDSLEAYVSGATLNRTPVSPVAALEETFFLGLRLNCGIDLRKVAVEFGEDAIAQFRENIADFVRTGLMESQGDVIRLSQKGRLLSNEVFERFLSVATVEVPTR